jgi:hypothetical protein
MFDNDDLLDFIPVQSPGKTNSYSEDYPDIVYATPPLHVREDLAEYNARFLEEKGKCPNGTRKNKQNVCIGQNIKRCSPGTLRVNGVCTEREGINIRRCPIGSRKRDTVGPGKYKLCIPNQTRAACSPGTRWNPETRECDGEPRLTRCPYGKRYVNGECIGVKRKTRCRRGTRFYKRLNKCRRRPGFEGSIGSLESLDAFV